MWKKILLGFTDPMIIILLIALLVQTVLFFLGETLWFEPVAIFVAILIANGVASISQSKQEGKAMTLKEEEESKEICKVLREGSLSEIAVSQVEDSLVVDGCFVDGTVKHSILSTGAQVKKGAVIEDSVIMSGAVIGKDAKIKRAIIGEGAIISDGVEIDGTEEVYVVGYNEKVGVPKDED